MATIEQKEELMATLKFAPCEYDRLLSFKIVVVAVNGLLSSPLQPTVLTTTSTFSSF
jgi:hypothetical protein